MSAQEELKDIQLQKQTLTLSLAKIRDMVNKGVVVNRITHNIIRFIVGNDREECPFESGYYTAISPSEILKAKRFFKADFQILLDNNAKEFDLLVKKEAIAKKLARIDEDF